MPVASQGIESVAELAQAVAARERTAREAVDAPRARIDSLNPRLNAVTRVLEEPLGEGPLAGVPFSVKENIDVAGTPTTFELPQVGRLAELWRDLLAYDSGWGALPRLRSAGCQGAVTFLENLLAIALPLDGPGYAAPAPSASRRSHFRTARS